MTDQPVTSIRVSRDGVEVSQPGASAADLVPVVALVLALLPADRQPFGYASTAGTGTIQDRRPSPNLDRGLSNGRHRPPPAPAVEVPGA